MMERSLEPTRRPFLTWDGQIAPVSEQTQPPCTCCGYRCGSQLEFMETNGGEPWPMCSACDPALDEPGSDWLCACREARGDANWERPEDDLFAKLEATKS